jgi:hypothetical protein
MLSVKTLYFRIIKNIGQTARKASGCMISLFLAVYPILLQLNQDLCCIGIKQLK